MFTQLRNNHNHKCDKELSTEIARYSSYLKFPALVYQILLVVVVKYQVRTEV